jgi:hypothetical protein
MKRVHSKGFYVIKALIKSIFITFIVCVVTFCLYRFVGVKHIVVVPATVASIAAVIFSITAGFSILIAFNKFQDVKSTIGQELANLGDLLDLTIYIEGQEALKEEIIGNVKEYGLSVANKEWKTLTSGEPHKDASSKLKTIMDSFNKIDITSEKNKIIFEMLVDEIKDLTTYRANRLKKAKESFPQLLTLTLYAVSLNLLMGVFLLLIPSVIFQMIILGFISLIIILIIQLVQDVGNPYEPGIWYISNSDYTNIKTSIITQIANN